MYSLYWLPLRLVNAAEHTVGVNRKSDSNKLPSDPMESQLLLQPCLNQQTVQWESPHMVGLTDTVELNTVEIRKAQPRNSAKQEHS